METVKAEDGTKEVRIKAATFIADFAGVPAGTDLHTLNLMRLVEILGRFREDEAFAYDADLLEAWLDASMEDWRERASGADVSGLGVGTDPYDVLGVPRGAGLDAVRATYRKAMMRVHPDTSGLPAWFAQQVADAFRIIKTRLEAETSPDGFGKGEGAEKAAADTAAERGEAA